MIKQVIVTNHLGESTTLELRFPEKSGFLVRGIDGLDPPKASINISEVASIDGAIFNSSRVNSRNVVFSLSFMDMPTIEDTRQKSYKYWPIKKRVAIKVETDNRICETFGYVETNEPNIFSDEEGSIISVICPDSYLYSVIKSITTFSGVQPLFEFPFSSEFELVDDDSAGSLMGVLAIPSYGSETMTPISLIEFGDIRLNTKQTIFYSGDASVGIVIYIHALGQVMNFRITNIGTRQSMIIDHDRLVALTGSGIIEGDDIVISTVKGSKFMYLKRGGQIFNILNSVSRPVSWFELEKGDNIFAYTATAGGSNIQLRIENQVAYEGI